MRKDRDFENIIENMGSTPPPLAPPPKPPKTIAAVNGLLGLVVFAVETLFIGFWLMVGHAIAIDDMGLSGTGIGFWTASTLGAISIGIIAVLRRATR